MNTRFCTNCGRELVEVEIYGDIQLRCPKFWPWYRFFQLPDYRHTRIMGDPVTPPRNYNGQTGERLQ